MATLKQLMQKTYREERKIIESKLHPNPIVRGIEIVHRHAGKNIEFTAWKGDDPVNNKFIPVDRLTVLYGEGFPLSQDNIDWLITE